MGPVPGAGSLKVVNTKFLAPSGVVLRMDRWTVVAAVLALALPGALAGCIARSQGGLDAASGDSGAAPGPVEAAAHLARARELAGGWRADARLVGVFATEGAPVDLEDPPLLFDTSTDPVVGDGLALVWTYAFAAPGERRSFFVAIDGAGALRYADDLPSFSFGHPMPVAYAESSPSPRPAEPEPLADLPDAVVASSAAAGAVAANATAQAWLAEHPVSFARVHLASSPEGPAWMVLRATSTGYALHALVDAKTLAVTDVNRFPDDFFPEPPHPCPADASCDPYEPQPPPVPAPESHARSVSVDAFNPRAEWPFVLGAVEWAAEIVVRADAGGATPLEAVTVSVFDPYGSLVASAAGTGALEIPIEHEDFPWGGEYRVVVEPQAPGPLPREIPLAADVTYTRWLGGANHLVDSMGGSVRMRQVVEHAVRVEEGASLLRVRVSFDDMINGVPAGARFVLVDPAGNEAGGVSSPGGTLEMESPTPGDWVLRAVGEDANVFGANYWWVATRVVPWMWH